MVTKRKQVLVMEHESRPAFGDVTSRDVTWVPLGQIDDNPWQPRTSYPQKDIAELAESIHQVGLRQYPEGRIVGRRVQLAYGHLRKRAYERLAKQRGGTYESLPVLLSEISDEQMMSYAMEENLRRRDVRPLDIARSIDRYLNEHSDMTEAKMGERLQMTQANISNMRRVLKLPPEILDKIDEGRINFTQARELLVFLDLGKALELMRGAIKGVVRPDGDPSRMMGGFANTVEGMQRSIDDVCRRSFPVINRPANYGYVFREDTLFDTSGCQECPKTIKTHPTKSGTAVVCVDEKCWRDKQDQHKKDTAKLAVSKVTEEIAQRVSADPAISQEISAEDVDAFRQASVAERAPTRPIREGDEPPVEPAKPELPAQTVELIKEKAGTRADLLDLKDLRMGMFSRDLRDGFEELRHNLDSIDDPDECTKRCTQGFHYAYDSERPSQEPLMVCGNRKCLGKKKGAFTRAQNARGQGLKKAEKAAIQQAVEETTELDRPRLLLLVYHMVVKGDNRYYSENEDRFACTWWLNKLGLKKQTSAEGEAERVIKGLEKWSDQKVLKAIVECALETLRYSGDIQHYKIHTKGLLAGLGVKITLA